ncbi:MAG TPA: Xaa-Pro aminopeptidase, partial [Candidatus Acidoferrum sp.]|nr:Xaa-Pro aminopeptidase [Candidatus Acidoferrum sp.]
HVHSRRRDAELPFTQESVSPNIGVAPARPERVWNLLMKAKLPRAKPTSQSKYTAALGQRYAPIEPRLFITNRERLRKMMLPRSLAVVNANDVLPTNADGSLRLISNSDLFYLTGIEQEQTILLLFPAADDEKQREMLFIRDVHPKLEIWEGHKLTKEEARTISGIERVHYLSEFSALFHRLMCECEHAYLNTNEHKRAVIEVETRESRFVAATMRHYPLHDYHRLARLMHQLRIVKSEVEVELIQQACALTRAGFRRVLKFTKPGVNEMQIEAELAHEFIRSGGGFAYTPIIAAGANACALHYIANNAECRAGDLLLLDVAASYANYNSDLTRTIPVSGRFTPRQRKVYDAVLRVMRHCGDGLRPGVFWKNWQKSAEQLIEKELVDLGLLTTREIKRQDPDDPALKKYFMHGVGHPIGLDVHDLGFTTEPMQAGWVMTVEPGIYIREEGFAVRLENTVVIGKENNIDLMSSIPIEAEEVEALMKR